MTPSGERRELGLLYICYLPLEEPLVATQVIPYLRGLADAGHSVHLLTYELQKLSRKQCEVAKAQLLESGISWHQAKYHKRPSLPATAFDALWGAVRAARIVKRHRLQVLHARVHVPALSALIAMRVTGAQLVFDVRGLMAEEYVDAGRWRPRSLPVKITKWVERRAVERSAGVVVLTEGAREPLLGSGGHPNLEVIPCCVDTSLFSAGMSKAAEVRAHLDLADKPVLAYAGKFSGWYAEREMVDFFAVARTRLPGLHFLVLTQSEPELITSEFERREISSEEFTVTSVAPSQMPEMLAAADFGLSFIKPLPSKVASSPTKNAEYLAAGLPFVATAGVGGTDEIARQTDTVVLIDSFSGTEYERAIDELLSLLGDPEIRNRCTAAAERLLSVDDAGVPRYRRLYERIGATSDAV